MSHTVAEWRQMILAAWEKWGTGKPLDAKTVEHLAQEFAKPMMPIPPPVINFKVDEWPWERHGAVRYNPLAFIHRTLFVPPVDDGVAWWDGSCLTKALVREGPKSIVLVKP